MYRKLYAAIILTVLFFIAAAPGFSNTYTPRVGEMLVYKVIVKSVIHGADQVIKVVSKGTFRNREIVNIQFSMDTLGLVRNITKYSEKEDMMLDAEGLYPWFIRHEVIEGEKTEVEEVSFDYQQGIAIRLFSKNNGPKKRTEIKLPGYVQDGLSLQFYLRQNNLVSGQHQLNFYADGKIEPVSFTVAEINKPLQLECGTFQPYIQASNTLSKITVTLSNNSDRQPLTIQKMAQFGKVEARLVKAN